MGSVVPVLKAKVIADGEAEDGHNQVLAAGGEIIHGQLSNNSLTIGSETAADRVWAIFQAVRGLIGRPRSAWMRVGRERRASRPSWARLQPRATQAARTALGRRITAMPPRSTVMAVLVPI